MESRNIALQGYVSTFYFFYNYLMVLLRRTLCTDGSGLGVCVCLGDSTVFGQFRPFCMARYVFKNFHWHIGRIAKEATRERPVRTTLEIEISRFVLISLSLLQLFSIEMSVPTPGSISSFICGSSGYRDRHSLVCMATPIVP